MIRKVVKLKPGERILAVVPHSASGPGWSNQLYWVYIGDIHAGTYRTESLQPNEQTAVQLAIFGGLEKLHEAVKQELCIEAVPLAQQREWLDLTSEEMGQLVHAYFPDRAKTLGPRMRMMMADMQARLKERNG